MYGNISFNITLPSLILFVALTHSYNHVQNPSYTSSVCVISHVQNLCTRTHPIYGRCSNIWTEIKSLELVKYNCWRQVTGYHLWWHLTSSIL